MPNRRSRYSSEFRAEAVRLCTARSRGRSDAPPGSVIRQDVLGGLIQSTSVRQERDRVAGTDTQSSRTDPWLKTWRALSWFEDRT